MAPHLKRDYYYTTNNENPFMTSFPLRNYSITDMTATGNGSYSYNHSVVTRSDRDGGKNINDVSIFGYSPYIYPSANTFKAVNVIVSINL